jgi:transposase
MVRKCVQMFNEGRENVNNEARNGRPSLVNDDLVHKVNERVHADSCFTFLICPCTLLRFQGLYDIVNSHLGSG